MLHILPNPGPTSSRIPSGGGAFVFPNIQPIVPSVVFDIDSTSGLSFDGTSQTWANLVATPADGSSQTAYDFLRGSDSSASANDPSFVGSPDTRSAEFSGNGSQYFTIRDGNTTFINNLHRTDFGGSWWAAITGSFVSRSSSVNGQSLFGTGGRDSATRHGMDFGNGFWDTSNKGYFQACGAQGFPGNVSLSGAADICTDNYIFIGLSYTPSTGAIKIYVGNNAAITAGNSFYASTVNASSPLQVLAGGVADAIAYSGTKLIGLSMGNALMTDTIAANLRSIYSTRHNRIY